MSKKSGFIQEFKKFILRGNVMDMAVGVIVGGAFTGYRYFSESRYPDTDSGHLRRHGFFEFICKAGKRRYGTGIDVR